jgi:hypothetical protein
MDGLRAEAKRQVDGFLAGGDIGTLFRWVTANRKAVYAGRDDETQELVDKARQTIDGVLKGLVEPDAARDHLRRLMSADRRFDRDSGGPEQRLA